MRSIDWQNNIYSNFKSSDKIRNFQMSHFFPKMAFGFFILSFLQACAPALYHVNLKYEPTGTSQKLEKAGTEPLITITMFNDIRQTDNKSQLGSVTTMVGSVAPILSRDMKITNAVTMNIRKYLYLSGYRVSSDVPVWDLKKETINKGWGEILIGGNIDALEIVCDDSFSGKTCQTNVILTFVFADVQKKKIFNFSTIETGASLDVTSFSEEILDKQINAALSDAVEKMLNDSEIKKKIDDASKITNRL